MTPLDVSVGQKVSRSLCGAIMELVVTEIDDELIHCGPWTFDRYTGMEIDKELGWSNAMSGSYLVGLYHV